jgi:hypothetical protein
MFCNKQLKETNIIASLNEMHGFYYELMGFGSAMRHCAVRTRHFRLTNTQTGALHAPPPPVAALLILAMILMIYLQIYSLQNYTTVNTSYY